jgi:hypothetical protein
MKPMTAEWVAKTEADFATAQRESRVRKNPNYDGIYFRKIARNALRLAT